MKQTAVTMPSVTHAIRAKRALSYGGIKSEIRRTPKVSENGCSHVLIVNSDSESVIAFFERNRLAYGKLLNNFNNMVNWHDS